MLRPSGRRGLPLRALLARRRRPHAGAGHAIRHLRVKVVGRDGGQEVADGGVVG
jgi:hypothetical protein